jgi:hypothetical protein
VERGVALGVGEVVVDALDVLQQVKHLNDAVAAEVAHRDLEPMLLVLKVKKSVINFAKVHNKNAFFIGHKDDLEMYLPKQWRVNFRKMALLLQNTYIHPFIQK